VAWFWDVVEGGGDGLTEAGFVEHVSDNAFSFQVALGSAPSFLSSLRSGVFAKAAPSRFEMDADGHVVTSFTSGDGLALEARFAFDLGSARRIASLGLRLAGGASVTAVSVAAWRAAHYALDDPVLLDDPLAEGLSGEFAAATIASVRADPAAFYPRWNVAARARWAEDTLAEAREGGVHQYVLLGAGLDSFAYCRSASGDRLRVFEVDHPASQSWKRDRLALLGVEIPESVTFVPCDFETEAFDTSLVALDFDPDQPSVVAWLGVSYYLSSQSISATLARISRFAPGTILVFDHFLPESTWDTFDGWDGNMFRAAAASVAASGEPWVTYLARDEVESMLALHGFASVDHLDNQTLLTTYMPGHPPGLPGPAPWSHTVRATIGG
jgi:methyltransferase (TIGR00027 family)